MKSILIVFAVIAWLPLLASVADASENGANDYLMTLSPNEQAKMLGKVVGEGCRGKIAFYQGSADDHAPRPNEIPPLSSHEHDAIWSVKCANGKSYSVGVHPKGDGQVIECSVLEALHGGHCFKKFE